MKRFTLFLVYHVSYTGNITLGPGDDIDDTPVASGCAELSEPVVVNAQLVDGGRLLTTANQTLLYVCANDGVDDIITVFNVTLPSCGVCGKFSSIICVTEL